ncbi:hypothetical protein [Paraflavitalea speifideaquila]|uniref:hypothetical protein n=1 Tax=Paraflavitalea speifideaquila TaxID=3076558 RepID=UPI0028E2F750|nr:hypothetical protein [Paraflavitalea speifideiaquila]
MTIKAILAKAAFISLSFVFLCMDIVRFEIQTTERISDLTADAISQLFTFGAFEYYYRDFRNIHEKCSDLFHVLSNYNEQLKNHDLPGLISIQDSNWVDFFSKSIAHLISSNK